MKNQEQDKELAEKQDESSCLKKPYKTPRLERLGNLEELTKGFPEANSPDDGDISI